MRDFLVSANEFWHEINDAFENAGGVYILKSYEEDGKTPKKVNRLLDSDKDGVLYIGKASSFLDRVIELKKSLSPKHRSSNHECGARYKQHDDLPLQLPYSRLFVTLEQTSNSRELESEQLKKYQDKFGELPPLNRSS